MNNLFVVLSLILVGCGGGSVLPAAAPPTPTVEMFDAVPASSEMLSTASAVLDVAQWRSGITPYASGFEQGTLSKTKTVIATFLAYDPTTKLITPTAAADIASFISGYMAGSGGVYPNRIFVLDDLMWDGNANPTASELYNMWTSAQQIVAFWRSRILNDFTNLSLYSQAMPGLLISIKPGILLNPNTLSMQVSVIVNSIDGVLLDTDMPADLTPAAYNWLYSIPEVAISTYSMCKNQAPLSGMVDLDVTTCAIKMVLPPRLGFGLMYQSFLETTDLTPQATLSTRKTQLLQLWQNMKTVAVSLKSVGQLWGVMPFGFYLDPANPEWSAMSSGQTFMDATDIASLKMYLSM